MKYSINGTGYIVAERDIYSLGGFIPKGSVGCKVANGDQISQDGECWVAGGDISARPDVRVKDNAYIGNFVGGITDIHTDGITEFSGDTLIPGKILVRIPLKIPVNNFFVKDSFIGVSMDVLCGPATGTNFPFEQGRYNQDAPKGTLFSSGSMKISADNSVRNTATLILGKNTYVYVPVGHIARIYWAYLDASDQLAYAGESETVPSSLYKLSHPVYNLCMIVFARDPTLTPAQLGTSGAKIIGHISGSLLQDFRPRSASGSYVMDNSRFVVTTSNFGLNTIQLRYLAGSMYDTNVYTPDGSIDYKIFGTFHNVQRLEYTKYLDDSHRTAATRDTYISAYDCPLLRVDSTTYGDALAAKGDLVLRRCIVPKAAFQDDVVNGNTYEDIDFSYANDFIRQIVAGSNLYSSHREGLYACESNGGVLGYISYPGNLADTARLRQAEKYIPLDGSIMEQGTYYGEYVYYENAKHDDTTRVRTSVPLPTRGALFPVLPAGFGVRAILYLDDNFVCKLPVTDPTTIETTYPYYVMAFKRDNLDETLSAKDFISLGLSLSIIDSSKVPEITGSAYVGAGCTVRGDVKLIGDPYVNRVFDVNMWERGISDPLPGGSWQSGFSSPGAHNRMRSKNLIQVEPGATIKRTDNNLLLAWFFDSFGKRTGSSSTGWVTSFVVPEGVSYVGLMIAKDGLLTEEDISLANVKYLRAFKKRRYIVNELDRTSPEDILLSVDYWEQGTAGGGQADAGKTYEELKAASGTTIRLKRPINVSPASGVSSASGFSRYIRVLDAVTKFHLGETLNSAKMALLATIIQKDPSGAITPADVTDTRIVIDFTPSPRIIVPYGSSNLFISGPKIRMYDNAVLSRNLNQEGEIVLRGDAVGGYDFNPGSCMCSNGHSDAIIKLP